MFPTLTPNLVEETISLLVRRTAGRFRESSPVEDLFRILTELLSHSGDDRPPLRFQMCMPLLEQLVSDDSLMGILSDFCGFFVSLDRSALELHSDAALVTHFPNLVFLHGCILRETFVDVASFDVFSLVSGVQERDVPFRREIDRFFVPAKPSDSPVVLVSSEMDEFECSRCSVRQKIAPGFAVNCWHCKSFLCLRCVAFFVDAEEEGEDVIGYLLNEIQTEDDLDSLDEVLCPICGIDISVIGWVPILQRRMDETLGQACFDLKEGLLFDVILRGAKEKLDLDPDALECTFALNLLHFLRGADGSIPIHHKKDFCLLFLKAHAARAEVEENQVLQYYLHSTRQVLKKKLKRLETGDSSFLEELSMSVGQEFGVAAEERTLKWRQAIQDTFPDEEGVGSALEEVLRPLFHCSVAHDDEGRLPWERSFSSWSPLPSGQTSGFYDDYSASDAIKIWLVQFSRWSDLDWEEPYMELQQFFLLAYESAGSVIGQDSKDGVVQVASEFVRMVSIVQTFLLHCLQGSSLADLSAPTQILVAHQRVVLLTGLCPIPFPFDYAAIQYGGFLNPFLSLLLTHVSILSKKVLQTFGSLLHADNTLYGKLSSLVYFFSSLGMRFMPPFEQTVLWLTSDVANEAITSQHESVVDWLNQLISLLSAAFRSARGCGLVNIQSSLMERLRLLDEAICSVSALNDSLRESVLTAYALSLSDLVSSRMTLVVQPRFLGYLKELGRLASELDLPGNALHTSRLLMILAKSCFQYSFPRLGVRIALEALKKLHPFWETSPHFRLAACFLPSYWHLYRGCYFPDFNGTNLSFFSLFSSYNDDGSNLDWKERCLPVVRRLGALSRVLHFDILQRHTPSIDNWTELFALFLEIQDVEHSHSGTVCVDGLISDVIRASKTDPKLAKHVEELRRSNSESSEEFDSCSYSKLDYRRLPMKLDRARMSVLSERDSLLSLPLLEECFRDHLAQFLGEEGVHEIDRLLLCRCVNPVVDEIIFHLYMKHERGDWGPLDAKRSVYYCEVMKSLSQVLVLSSRSRYLFEGFEIPDHEDTIVLYHLSTNCPLNPDAVYRWVIRAGEVVHWDRLFLRDRLPAETLREAIGYFASSMSVIGRLLRKRGRGGRRRRRRREQQIREEKEKIQSSCVSLYNVLILGLEEHVPRDPDELVYIVPSAELFFVPFGALFDSQSHRYFIDDHVFTIVSGLSMIEIGDAQRQTVMQERLVTDPDHPLIGALVCGHTSYSSKKTLLESKREIADIVTEVSSQSNEETSCLVLVQQQFTSDHLRECLLSTRPRYVHFSTHCSSRDQPEYQRLPSSALPMFDTDPRSIFAQFRTRDDIDQFKKYRTSGWIGMFGDETLHADSIPEVWSGLRGCELIYFSACMTGGGRLCEEGILGFHRAVFRIGVPSVVCSLWSVFDKPSAKISKAFYQALLREPRMTKAAALRRAVLIWRNGEGKRYLDTPGCWAAYQLFGCPH